MPRFDSDIAHDKSTTTYAPVSDAGHRPPVVNWTVNSTATYAPVSDAGHRPPVVNWAVTGPAVMVARPPGAHLIAEAESMDASRVKIRDARPDHWGEHIADVTVWASGPEPLTEETIAVASAIYWSWWRALDMHGNAP